MNKTYYAKKLNAERLRRVYEIAGPRVCQYLQAEIDHLAGFVQPGDKILELDAVLAGCWRLWHVSPVRGGVLTTRRKAWNLPGPNIPI